MQTQTKMTHFGLIRHAQTFWNREKRIQGHSDSPLTPEGEQQAHRWGRILKRFSWNRLLVSDTGRAVTTAEIINSCLKLPLTIDSRLREQDWGRWAGKTVAQIDAEASWAADEQRNAGWDFCPPGGESRREVLQRSREALQEAAEWHAGESLLVVSHEGVAKCLIYYLYGRKFLPDELPILESYRLHRLSHGRSGLQIEELNALELGVD